jgi:hypothetical protein
MIEQRDTSSIGPQWPPNKSSFNRIKGIYTNGVVRDSKTFVSVVNNIKDLATQQTKIDRLSIRVIADNNVWRENSPMLEGIGEVIMPLDGTSDVFSNSSILYLGINSPERQSDNNDLRKAINNVECAIRKKPVSFIEAINRVCNQGFYLSILTLSDRSTNNEIINQMTELYKRFGWERSDVVEILGKPNNIIAIAKNNNEIVSAGIAEISTIQLQDNSRLRMAEITEAATDERYQKKGLYSSVVAKLMMELAMNESQIDLVFGECNGNELGVLNTARSLGRTFSYEIATREQLPFKGFLPQHVPIAGQPRNTPYNDLFPSYITKDRLTLLNY